MSERVFVLRDDSHQLRVSVIFDFLLFSRSAERSEFLIESEAQSAESLSDAAPMSRVGGCKSRSGFLYLSCVSYCYRCLGSSP